MAGLLAWAHALYVTCISRRCRHKLPNIEVLDRQLDFFFSLPLYSFLTVLLLEVSTIPGPDRQREIS